MVCALPLATADIQISRGFFFFFNFKLYKWTITFRLLNMNYEHPDRMQMFLLTAWPCCALDGEALLLLRHFLVRFQPTFLDEDEIF